VKNFREGGERENPQKIYQGKIRSNMFLRDEKEKAMTRESNSGGDASEL